MSTILVEARRDPAPAAALDCLAEVCHAVGHEVFRWRGPLSGRVPQWRWLFACDLAILWNGSHPRYASAVGTLQQRGASLLFAELGWHPQKNTIQLDPQGINARASWASEPLAAPALTPLAVRPDGDLLVVLQLDRDTQITQLSPWFENMRALVEFICRNSALPVRVRPHPREAPSPEFRRRVLELGGAWDNSRSLAEAMASAKALACINSSCGVEALAAGLPVLCYGGAVYRHPGAVLCLDDDPATTRSATAELAAGYCPLYRERMEAAVSRVLSQQWQLSEITSRLPPLLDEVLASRVTRPVSTSPWLAPLIRFTRDRVPEWFDRIRQPAVPPATRSHS